jgi:hypothetical protein
MIENDIYGEIIKIIDEETLYLRHFVGEIVDIDDELKKGRVKVTLPELGMDTPSLAIWCNPRQGSSMIVPKVGQWAEVYFINGDRMRPVYLYPASEIKDNTLKNYTGDTKEKYLFEDSDSKSNNIKYNQSEKEITIFDGEDYAVKYNELKTAFDQLKDDFDNFVNTVYNVHVHVVTTPDTINGTAAATVNTGSSSTADMSNSKVEKVRLS